MILRRDLSSKTHKLPSESWTVFLYRSARSGAERQDVLCDMREIHAIGLAVQLLITRYDGVNVV